MPSQFGQDQFLLNVFEKKSGVFLDIGASAPSLWSNTDRLEEHGWTGACFDNRVWNYRTRSAAFKIEDVTLKSYSQWWDDLKRHARFGYFDYLSLDVDDNTNAALSTLPFHLFKFRVIQVEHDYYRVGSWLRDFQRTYLKLLGYQLVRPDVCFAPGHPFEDWWALPEMGIEPKRGNLLVEEACEL